MDRTRTPSPPPRLRTPPAPRLGAKLDSYEPFSPRRSSRVAAKHHNHLHLPSSSTSPTRSHTRLVRDATPTSSRKTTAPSASITLSPPSSPASPAKKSIRRQRSTAPAEIDDSESDQISAPTPARNLFSRLPPQGALPTPAKTPRKRTLKTDDSLGPTARVLFPNRPVTIEDAMPTPRKARKTTAFTLESFADQMDEGSSKIEVFTDSKERIPTRDDEEDNPFITKKGKGKAKAPQRRKVLDRESEKMFEAANHDEGMVFTFKGKKIFRKFNDGPPSNASEGEHTLWAEAETARRAGVPDSGRITRSSIKPRILFQEEIAKQKRERGEEDDDEEAVTDIEPQVATPSRKARTTTTAFLQAATPPPTKRVQRQISFESWSRVKSSARSDTSSRGGKKRSGPPLENPTDKRARGEQSTPSAPSSGQSSAQSSLSFDDIA